MRPTKRIVSSIYATHFIVQSQVRRKNPSCEDYYYYCCVRLSFERQRQQVHCVHKLSIHTIFMSHIKLPSIITEINPLHILAEIADLATPIQPHPMPHPLPVYYKEGILILSPKKEGQIKREDITIIYLLHWGPTSPLSHPLRSQAPATDTYHHHKFLQFSTKIRKN